MRAVVLLFAGFKSVWFLLQPMWFLSPEVAGTVQTAAAEAAEANNYERYLRKETQISEELESRLQNVADIWTFLSHWWSWLRWNGCWQCRCWCGCWWYCLMPMLRIPASLPSSKSSGNNKRTGSVSQYLKGLADLQTCSWEHQQTRT